MSGTGSAPPPSPNGSLSPQMQQIFQQQAAAGIPIGTGLVQGTPVQAGQTPQIFPGQPNPYAATGGVVTPAQAAAAQAQFGQGQSPTTGMPPGYTPDQWATALQTIRGQMGLQANGQTQPGATPSNAASKGGGQSGMSSSPSQGGPPMLSQDQMNGAIQTVQRLMQGGSGALTAGAPSSGQPSSQPTGIFNTPQFTQSNT